MKLKIFQSDKGDCLLLEGATGGTVLVDGGMRESYRKHVAAELQKIHDGKKKLDLVYVSHIDQDHISGVLQMLDDLVDWRVYEYQKSEGLNPDPPEGARPPEIVDIWHNAFHEQIGDNAGPIGDMLAASATFLSAADGLMSSDLSDRFRTIVDRRQDLASSVSEAIQLSRHIGEEQLGIPLNRHFPPKKKNGKGGKKVGGRLAYIETAPEKPITFGSLTFTVIGPFEEDLEKLREEWNLWLAQHKKQLGSVQNRARRDSDRLANDVDRILQPTLEQAEVLQGIVIEGLKEWAKEDAALAAAEGKTKTKKLGRRDSVTAPNLASLMVLVEEKSNDGTRTMLLTGDGHSQDILKGLRHHKRLGKKDSEAFHVDVLKVQHHGSEHNIEEEFVKTITADHYIFCGNGEHANPDLDVVKLILDTRLANDDRKFKLWFNSNETASEREDARKHMIALKKLIESTKKKNPGRISVEFMKESESFMELEV